MLPSICFCMAFKLGMVLQFSNGLKNTKRRIFPNTGKLWEIQISVPINKVLLAPHHTYLLLPCLRLLLCPSVRVEQLWQRPRRYWVPWLWDGFTAAHPAICFIYSILLSVHRHHVKTGKVDFECHTFNAWWGADYYFIELHGRALCFLWTVLIKYSIYWHHSNPSSQKKNETISSNTSHHSRISSQNKKTERETENRLQSK